MNSTLKTQVNAYKGKITCDDNIDDLASIYPFYLDSSEITNTDPFSNDSNVTSIDLATSSDASSIMDSSVFIDCSI